MCKLPIHDQLDTLVSFFFSLTSKCKIKQFYAKILKKVFMQIHHQNVSFQFKRDIIWKTFARFWSKTSLDILCDNKMLKHKWPVMSSEWRMVLVNGSLWEPSSVRISLSFFSSFHQINSHFLSVLSERNIISSWFSNEWFQTTGNCCLST